MSEQLKRFCGVRVWFWEEEEGVQSSTRLAALLLAFVTAYVVIYQVHTDQIDYGLIAELLIAVGLVKRYGKTLGEDTK